MLPFRGRNEYQVQTVSFSLMGRERKITNKDQVAGLRSQGSGHRAQVTGLRAQGAGRGAQGAGLRAQASLLRMRLRQWVQTNQTAAISRRISTATWNRWKAAWKRGLLLKEAPSLMPMYAST